MSKKHKPQGRQKRVAQRLKYRGGNGWDHENSSVNSYEIKWQNRGKKILTFMKCRPQEARIAFDEIKGPKSIWNTNTVPELIEWHS